MTMQDPFLEVLGESDQQASQVRLSALNERARIANESRRTPARPLVSPEAPRGNGNVEDRRPSLLERIRKGAQSLTLTDREVGDVAAGIGAGVVRAPGVLVGSVMDFANDTDRFIGEIADSAFVRKPRPEGVSPSSIALGSTPLVGAALQGANAARNLLGGSDDDTWSDLLSLRQSLGRVGNDSANQATAVIVASILPAVATGGASTTATFGGTALRTAGVGAFGGGVVNDPYQERISNGLQQLGIHTEFVEWLAQDPNDSVMESRFKGAIEGVVAEGAAEGVFWTLKAAKAVFRGDAAGAAAARAEARRAFNVEGDETPAIPMREATPEEAARENLDKSFAQARTEEARAAQIQRQLDDEAQQADLAGDAGGAPQQTPPAQPGKADASGEAAGEGFEELPQGTRRGDATPDGGQQPVPPLLDDAQEALKRAGSPEELTPENFRLSADGKVIVSKESKRLADEAGYGRSFAEDTGVPRDDVIFATAGRTVGTMDRASVTQFAEEVAEWSARGVDDVAGSHPAGAFKITTLGDPEDIQPLLRALVDRVPGKVAVSVDEMMAASARVADEIGQDTNAMLAFAEQAAGSTENLYAVMGATRTMWSRLAANVEKHLTVNVDALGDDAFEALATDIRNTMTFSGSFAQVKSSLGRGLYAARLPDADSYVRALRRGLPDEELAGKVPGAEPLLPRTKQEVKDWLEGWKAFDGDPTGRALWLENKFQLPAPGMYLRTSVANFFTANILSAPRTLMLNVVGPSLIGGIRTLEKTSGGFLGSLNPLLPVAQRRELLATASAAPQAYLQAMGDFQDAIKFGLQSLKSGQPVLGGGGSIRDAATQMGPISPGMLKAAQYNGNASAYAIGNVINWWPRQLQRANAGLDEFAKRLSYMGEARAGFLVEGSTKGLRGKELNEFVREKLLSTVDSLGHAESDELLRSAERSTFTGQVGSEGSFSRGFSEGVSKARQQFPELRYIMPIFNVPANALGETLRRIPVLGQVFKETQKELSGALGPVAQAEAHGRFITGAAMLGSGYGLTRMGLLTGSGPKDPRDRAVWLQTHQPYSIKVGDQWVDYSRYDIVGALFSIPATLYDRSVNRPQDEGWEQAMMGGMAAMAEYLRDRAALQNVSDLLALGSGTTDSGQFLPRMINNTIAGLAVPAFVTGLARNPTDDVVRTKSSIGDYIWDKLPILSQELDPMRNILGEYVHKPQDSLIEGLIPLTMSSAFNPESDSVMAEISRLNESTGYAAGVITPNQTMGGHFDPRTVKLEEGDSLWNLITYNRSVVTVEGKTLREALGELFESDRYDQALDADASNLTLSTGEESRGALVSEVFADYNKAAKAQAAKDSPIAARWLAIAKAKSADDGRLRTVNAKEAAENPDLLESLGINIQNYEAAVAGDQ